MSFLLSDILKYIGADSIGTKEVLNQRLGELTFCELQFLLNEYNCCLVDLVDKMWSVTFEGGYNESGA